MLVLSRVWNFVTLWTVACQAALSMGFFRQKSWSRLPFFSSKASSQPRDWTHVPCMSCIAGRFFTCLSHQGSSQTSVYILRKNSEHLLDFVRSMTSWRQNSETNQLRWSTHISCRSETPGKWPEFLPLVYACNRVSF